jgi:dihydropteroate synthase
MTTVSPPPTPFPQYPRRAALWRLRSRTLDLPSRPRVMGIVNVTPDSFSDGGKFFGAEAAIAHGRALIAAGADLLDVGGESTRPYAQPIDQAEELRRVLPVVTALAQSAGVPISIDTSKPAVARACLAAGAEIVNDVTALTDPAMVEVALEFGAGVCAMHMQGMPQTMQDNPRYDVVVEDVLRYLVGRRDALVAAGITAQHIALDPGIGFGKTHEHNLTLLAHAERFHETGCPLLLGPSRKGFIGKVLADKEADRTAGTIGVVLSLAAQGVQVVRVHDVREVRQALLLFEATGGTAGHYFK